MKYLLLGLTVILFISCTSNFLGEGISLLELESRTEQWGMEGDDRSVEVFYEKGTNTRYTGKVHKSGESYGIEPAKEYFISRGQIKNGVKEGTWYKYVGYDELVHHEYVYKSGEVVKQVDYNVTEGHEGEILFIMRIEGLKPHLRKHLEWYGWCGQMERKKIVNLFTNETELDRDYDYCD